MDNAKRATLPILIRYVHTSCQQEDEFVQHAFCMCQVLLLLEVSAFQNLCCFKVWLVMTIEFVTYSMYFSQYGMQSLENV